MHKNGKELYQKMCFTCRVRITRIYTYNSNSDRSEEIPLYNSNYVPFPFDMTPPVSHFYSVTSNSNLSFAENHRLEHERGVGGNTRRSRDSPYFLINRTEHSQGFFVFFYDNALLSNFRNKLYFQSEQVFIFIKRS